MHTDIVYSYFPSLCKKKFNLMFWHERQPEINKPGDGELAYFIH